MTATKAKSIPEGFNSVVPFVLLKDTAKAVEFYRKAVCVEVLRQYHTSDGSDGYGDPQIGNSRVRFADASPERK
ncbi:hypothetical protein LXT21_25950 [Myxococcus sp. K38C18041901]|uniref:VOC family protein n=1 Tax=Myxococcus guangdongensis TaxID=2906760 RepID=UPI0020A7A216|nr:VOC family protein [Myxococcus guangdongensis]MCP3062237.1 hypothetical protein [Myxococcus guangdongensis]